MRGGQQAYRIGIVALDDTEQFPGSLPLLGGKEGLSFTFNLGQYLRVQTVSLFLRPVLRLRRPGVQQAEERHRFAALTQTGSNALRQRPAEGIAKQVIGPVRLLRQQGLQMLLAHFIEVCRAHHRPFRSRRLDAGNRPARAEIAGQHAELPGKTRCRMETEQRWSVADAQRQNRIKAQALRLLIAEIGRQQRAQFPHRRGHHHLPGRHLTSQLAAELRRQAHCQQRMTAEGEEIGFNVVHFTAQQPAERLCDRRFHSRLRRSSAAFTAQRRQRQRFAIQFAVGAQRQFR